MKTKALLWACIVVSFEIVCLFSGCKDDPTQPQPSTQTFYDKSIQPIFTNNCTNLGCHPGGGAPFSLMEGASFDNLVNVAATNGACPGTTLRVKPGSADSSVLYQRIQGLCGLNRMPKGFPPINTTLIDSIAHWINRGAHKES